FIFHLEISGTNENCHDNEQVLGHHNCEVKFIIPIDSGKRVSAQEVQQPQGRTDRGASERYREQLVFVLQRSPFHPWVFERGEWSADEINAQERSDYHRYHNWIHWP
ncbi:hypothetical protein PENTCL1PPCAC_10282, partial [Pristionchus entomophagus]